jgi:hypothetical protein
LTQNHWGRSIKMRLEPVPQSQPAAGGIGVPGRGAKLRLRLRVLLHRGALDRQLSDGLAADGAEDRALRAHQLGDARTRRRLAKSLRGLIAEAELTPTARLCSAVPVRPRAVLRWRQALLGLAERLEAADPVDPCGVARVMVLLTDGNSPVYDPHPARSMKDAIWWIADGLRLRGTAI